MMKIRVLHVLDKININSGVSAVVMNYYMNIDRTKIQFDFLVHEAIEEELLNNIISMGAKVYYMPSYSIKSMIHYSRDFKKVMMNTNYNIIHCHVPHEAFFCLKNAKKIGINQRIVHSHNSVGSDILVNRIRNFFLTKIGLLYSNNFFACSKSAADYTFGRNSRARGKCIYILNAINVDTFKFDLGSRGKLRNEFNIDDKVVIGHIGRFSKQKNHLFLLDIFKKWKEEVPESVLVLIGTGELENVIKKTVYEYQLENSVLFLENRKDISQILCMMDIFVLPSLYEGLPVVLVEAQVSGLPCVISETITNEVVIGDVSYVSINDGVQNWVETMKMFLNDSKDQYIRIDRSERSKESQFNIKIQARRLEEVYQQLLKKE